jgi:predicted metal-dependent phosphoesterase TrpH
MCPVPWLGRICRECYSEPRAVYETLKARGMDLVTVTDHDSIDASESLRSKLDFFLSEEVTAQMPSGTEIHIGVYGIDERQHQALQARRKDFHSLIAYLNEQRLLFSINHAFSSLTGRRVHGDFRFFADHFPAIETLNGHMLHSANVSAAAFAAQWRKIVVGGSDAHTLDALGRAYTEISGSKNARDFLDRLRLGHSRVYGESGSYLRLTRVVGSVARSMVRENPWTALLFPLLFAAPIVTLVNYVSEVIFNYRWSRRAERVGATRTEPAYVPDLVV